VSLPLPSTLFARTGLSVGAALLLFALLSAATSYHYLIRPVAKRAADDLAALLVLSSQTWVELPPATRPDYERELERRHHLRIRAADSALAGADTSQPYLGQLRQALEHRLGFGVPIGADPATPGWYWVDISMGSRTLQVGFPDDRLGEHLPLTLLIVIAGGAVILLLTTLMMVRHLIRPLDRLESATRQVGRGRTVPPLPVGGPRELANLTHSFNRMQGEIRDLLASRTTLLAGISHDLRTPLARMEVALELLHDSDPGLVTGMRGDIAEMDRLIAAALELARGSRLEALQGMELNERLGALVEEYRNERLRLLPGPPCRLELPAQAFRRVVGNLLDNALRYSGEQPVTIACGCGDGQALVRIIDRGPGIPAGQREAVFRPFHRLENSRSRDTGGSGLGLAIVRQLCELYGWEMELIEPEHQGLEVQLRIPLPAEAEP